MLGAPAVPSFVGFNATAGVNVQLVNGGATAVAATQQLPTTEI